MEVGAWVEGAWWPLLGAECTSRASLETLGPDGAKVGVGSRCKAGAGLKNTWVDENLASRNISTYPKIGLIMCLVEEVTYV